MKTTPADLSEVFAIFCEKLHEALRGQESTAFEAEHARCTKGISTDEVAKSLMRMKNDKAVADDGLVAEMLKAGNEKLIKATASFFSDLLCEAMTSIFWELIKEMAYIFYLLGQRPRTLGKHHG